MHCIMSHILQLIYSAALLPFCGCPKPRVGHLEYMDVKSCPIPNIAKFYNFSVLYSNKIPSVSVNLDMPREVKTISKASIKLEQCVTNKPCKHFYTVRFAAGACNLIGDKNAFWSPVFAEAEPDFVCPLEPITYSIRKASIDFKRFLRLFNTLDPNLGQPAIWNSKLQAYDENKQEFACVDVKIKHVPLDE